MRQQIASAIQLVVPGPARPRIRQNGQGEIASPLPQQGIGQQQVQFVKCTVQVHVRMVGQKPVGGLRIPERRDGLDVGQLARVGCIRRRAEDDSLAVNRVVLGLAGRGRGPGVAKLGKRHLLKDRFRVRIEIQRLDAPQVGGQAFRLRVNRQVGRDLPLGSEYRPLEPALGQCNRLGDFRGVQVVAVEPVGERRLQPGPCRRVTRHVPPPALRSGVPSSPCAAPASLPTHPSGRRRGRWSARPRRNAPLPMTKRDRRTA